MERRIIKIEITPEPSESERTIIENGIALFKTKVPLKKSSTNLSRSRYGAPQLRNFQR